MASSVMNKNIKLIIILMLLCVPILIIAIIFSCSKQAQIPYEERQRRQIEIETHPLKYNLEYGKDPRTGFCFAIYEFGLRNGLLTYVPCTSEVEKLLK
jgi:hypothetical protein